MAIYGCILEILQINVHSQSPIFFSKFLIGLLIVTFSSVLVEQNGVIERGELKFFEEFILKSNVHVPD